VYFLGEQRLALTARARVARGCWGGTQKTIPLAGRATGGRLAAGDGQNKAARRGWVGWFGDDPSGWII